MPSFFSSTAVMFAFQVRDVRMISDRNSRRSKGIAYVEFVDVSSVPLAIGLTGQRVLGVPIIVQASQVRAVNLVFNHVEWCLLTLLENLLFENLVTLARLENRNKDGWLS